jgi:hypothetical protein
VTAPTESGNAVRSPRAEKSGALIIRIWVEQDAPLRVLARISSTTDLDEERHSSTVASSTHEIEEAVRGWLNSFVEAATGNGYPPEAARNREKRSRSSAESNPN